MNQDVITHSISPASIMEHEVADRIVDGFGAFLLHAYTLIAIAIALTAMLALLFSASNSISDPQMVGSSVIWLLLLLAEENIAPIIGNGKLSLETSQALFLVFALCRGIWFIVLFAYVFGETIMRLYLASTALLFCMSIFHIAASRDAARLGYYLFNGVWMIVFIVIMLAHRPADQFMLLLASVLFSMLTFYGFQGLQKLRDKLKDYYKPEADGEIFGHSALKGVFDLYYRFFFQLTWPLLYLSGLYYYVVHWT